jgi:hypothetical protein
MLESDNLRYCTEYELQYIKFDNIPDDFNVVQYKELNEDLKGITENDAKLHYENNGYIENRKYKFENIPEDFNARDYIELNEDLKHMSEIEAKVHYENNGYKENRNYISNKSTYN